MKLYRQLTILFLLTLFTNCVQQAHPKTITVKVDMNGIENPSRIGLRGSSPLSWEETTYLNDKDGDGIYEEIFEIYTANHDIEFKFVNNDSQFELKDQNNRRLTFEYKPETITYSAVFDNPKEVNIIRE